MSDSNPLVERVDALLKRHQQQQAAPAPLVPEPLPPLAQPAAPETVAHPVDTDHDVPVLTEVVDPHLKPVAGAPPQALAEGIEAAVLEKLLAEIERSLESSLNRSVGEVVEQVMDGLRAELSVRVRLSVREAVAAALAKELSKPARPPQ